MNELKYKQPDVLLPGMDINGTEGAVSSNSYYATKVALDILKAGGNAYDAAFALSMVLSVVEPHHSGIGGGCFTVAYNKHEDDTIAIDARGVAPKNAHKDMFLDENGDVKQEEINYGGKSVAVPSLIKSMNILLEKYGTMSMEELLQPAIDIARDGFSTSVVMESIYGEADMSKKIELSEDFARLYSPNGQPLKFGKKIKNEDQAKTLELIAKEGIDVFYKGEIADDIVKAINNRGGVFTKEDLAEYEPVIYKPVKGSFRGYDIVSICPPSSGGAHIIQMLNILENFDLKGMGYGSADAMHVVAETMKIAFADRSVAMGDPRYVDIQLEKIISKEYANERASQIKMDIAQDFEPAEGIEGQLKHYPGNTSHFSIVDKYGNVVSQTQTIRDWFASGIIPENRGFILNNAMADFSPKVGVRTTQGLKYGMANCIEGGKTPLSSMSPTLVFKDGELVMSIGAAGGPFIITGTLQSILHTIEFDMLMGSAISSTHIACFSQDQGLEVEYNASPDTLEILENRGHKILKVPAGKGLIDMSNGILKKNGLFYPMASSRLDGCSGAITEDGFISLRGISF